MAKDYRLLQAQMSVEARARSQAKADRMIAAMALAAARRPPKLAARTARRVKRRKRVDS